MRQPILIIANGDPLRTAVPAISGAVFFDVRLIWRADVDVSTLTGR